MKATPKNVLFELEFSDSLGAVELERTTFLHPGTIAYPDPKIATRGRNLDQTQSIDNYDKFEWKVATQALSIWMLHIAAWHYTPKQEKSEKPPALVGWAESPADKLDTAITDSRRKWLLAMFSRKPRELEPYICECITHANKNLKREEEPVRILLRTDMLPPSAIKVVLNGNTITDAGLISSLARRIKQDKFSDYKPPFVMEYLESGRFLEHSVLIDSTVTHRKGIDVAAYSNHIDTDSLFFDTYQGYDDSTCIVFGRVLYDAEFTKHFLRAYYRAKASNDSRERASSWYKDIENDMHEISRHASMAMFEYNTDKNRLRYYIGWHWSWGWEWGWDELSCYYYRNNIHDGEGYGTLSDIPDLPEIILSDGDILIIADLRFGLWMDKNDIFRCLKQCANKPAQYIANTMMLDALAFSKSFDINAKEDQMALIVIKYDQRLVNAGK